MYEWELVIRVSSEFTNTLLPSDAFMERKTIPTHCHYVHICVQLHSTLCNPMDYTACQASLSIEFSRQGYWNGLPFPTPWDFPKPEIKLVGLASLTLAGGFFTTVSLGKPEALSLNSLFCGLFFIFFSTFSIYWVTSTICQLFV